ncbi:MAG TPA: DUF72 domain-containing protein [Bryobacteraceae bacterium]|jgi:uncharacterized protein YecE (DUF72 family)|nr:DUF72 domain-containing protein [Bryobacteraceae bacterium]
MQNLPLFEEPVPETTRVLRKKLSQMAKQSIYVGTSSWKYQGWLGQIYTRERYSVRGKLSKKRFEGECLAEYAETFPVVCGDFSFYQFPSSEFWRCLFESAPSTLRFAFKIPEEVTVRAFPTHPRYGPRSGAVNPNFLDTDLLKVEFLDLLAPYRDRIAVLIFEFGTFPKTVFASVDEFLNALAPAVAQLPREFHYAVEVRNPEFLGADYFGFLHDANIAHVLSSWTRMPPLAGQMLMPGAFTAGFTVARALLRPGRKYEDAVNLFSPYREVQEPNEEVRNALRNLLIRSKQRAEETYIFVNNRLEGNAPQTIEAVVADW